MCYSEAERKEKGYFMSIARKEDRQTRATFVLELAHWLSRSHSVHTSKLFGAAAYHDLITAHGKAMESCVGSMLMPKGAPSCKD